MARAAPKQSIITPAIIMLTIFFMLLGLSNAGISNFGVVALMSGYGVDVLGRQYRADRVSRRQRRRRAGRRLSRRPHPRHGQVAAACFGVNAVIMLVIATVSLPSLLLTAAMGMAGFLGGVIAPSRDMLVRNAAPPGAAGRAFGIVSTGFNFCGILSPLLFGWIMDQNMPHWVFGASVVFMVLTVLLALVTDRKPQSAVGRSGHEADAFLNLIPGG